MSAFVNTGKRLLRSPMVRKTAVEFLDEGVSDFAREQVGVDAKPHQAGPPTLGGAFYMGFKEFVVRPHIADVVHETVFPTSYAKDQRPGREKEQPRATPSLPPELMGKSAGLHHALNDPVYRSARQYNSSAGTPNPGLDNFVGAKHKVLGFGTPSSGNE